jgi:replication initiation and membrane attachment protein
MRISNMLHFTENHPFYCGRFFALGSLHHTMLSNVYQPMIGPLATSLYHVLYESLPAHQVGYSPIEQQRKLFLSLQLEPGADGRRKLAEAASRLEAVGLLHSSRVLSSAEDDYLYVYHLHPPLLPHEFFTCHHLVFLLRDTIGSRALLRLRERLLAPSPLEEEPQVQEDLTVPFYEIFRLRPDAEPEDVKLALGELAAGQVRERAAPGSTRSIGYACAEIVQRFPRASRNRRFVERLDKRPDQLAFINYTAAKYRLELQELCRLLDEDGIFDESGELNEETFAYRASLHYVQGNKRREDRELFLNRALGSVSPEEGQDELPAEAAVDAVHQLEVPEQFSGKCDKQQYNQLLRNEPYTAVLELFFKDKPPTHAVRLLERIHFSYQIPDEVINVLIHYIQTNRLSWAKAFVESTVTDLLALEVRTFEAAVDFFRERKKIADKSKERTSRMNQAASSRKRKSPPIITDNVPDETVSKEEYERILQKVKMIQSRLK